MTLLSCLPTLKNFFEGRDEFFLKKGHHNIFFRSLERRKKLLRVSFPLAKVFSRKEKMKLREMNSLRLRKRRESFSFSGLVSSHSISFESFKGLGD